MSNQKRSRGRGGCCIVPFVATACGMSYVVFSGSSQEESYLEDDSNSSFALNVQNDDYDSNLPLALNIQNHLHNLTENLLKVIEDERYSEKEMKEKCVSALVNAIITICFAGFTCISYKKLEEHFRKYEGVYSVEKLIRLKIEAIAEAKQIISMKVEMEKKNNHSDKPIITEAETSVEVNVSVVRNHNDEK